jgi:hypothetical protein
MEIILFKIVSGIILFIIYLLFSELGVFKAVYEELYTHPESTAIKKFCGSLISDIFYIVGGSTIASTVFMVLTTTQGLNVSTFTWGLVFAIIGKYLKEN